MDYNPRKQRHRGEPKNHLHNLSLPVHQALSWWQRAESCQNGLDGQFIFLWTAYAWALEGLNESDADNFFQSLTKICDVDQNEDLTKLGCDVYPSSIRLDGVNLLVKLVPIIIININMMMDNPEALWSEANYSLVE